MVVTNEVRAHPYQSTVHKIAQYVGGGAAPVVMQLTGTCLFPSLLGCRSFSGPGARQYCQSIGMRAVSLDNPGKTNFFMNLVANAGERYFWTGGSVGNGGVVWPNGVRQSNNQVGPWSHTGG